MHKHAILKGKMEEQMTCKEVNYKLLYTGEDIRDLKKGNLYTCVKEWYDEDGKLDSYRIIDETGEPYIYGIKSFEKVK